MAGSTADPVLFSHFELDPDKSIRDEVLYLDDAIVVPPTRRLNWMVEAGIFDAQRRPVPVAQGWHGHSSPATKFPAPPSGDVEKRTGTYLYLGHDMRHFGHFILETTGRLWFLDAYDQKVDGLVVLAQPTSDRQRVERDISNFMALCGFDVPPFLWTEGPVSLERLIVPKQGSGALKLMNAAPEHRKMITERFRANVEPAGPKKLYISRTEFDHKHGSLLEEQKIQSWLEEEGFTAFHPQHHDLRTQVAHYRAAEVIVGVDGTPFHVVAYATHPKQKVVVIKRRPGLEARLQAEQVQHFGAGQASLINELTGAWAPAGERRVSISVFGIADLEKIGAQLFELGIIKVKSRWKNSDILEIRERLREVGARLDSDMFEVRSGGQSLAKVRRRRSKKVIRLYSLQRQERGAKSSATSPEA